MFCNFHLRGRLYQFNVEMNYSTMILINGRVHVIVVNNALGLPKLIQ